MSHLTIAHAFVVVAVNKHARAHITNILLNLMVASDRSIVCIHN